MDEKTMILRQRAKEMAKRPAKDSDIAEESIELVEFTLAGERYALEAKHIREVYPLRGLTPVPCTPSFIVGIINVRGQLMAVTDLREFFELPTGELTPESMAIILESSTMDLAILAGSVVGDMRIPVSRIHPNLPTLKGVQARFMKGVTKDGLAVLDAEDLLSDNSLVVREEVGD